MQLHWAGGGFVRGVEIRVLICVVTAALALGITSATV